MFVFFIKVQINNIEITSFIALLVLSVFEIRFTYLWITFFNYTVFKRYKKDSKLNNSPKWDKEGVTHFMCSKNRIPIIKN